MNRLKTLRKHLNRTLCKNNRSVQVLLNLTRAATQLMFKKVKCTYMIWGDSNSVGSQRKYTKIIKKLEKGQQELSKARTGFIRGIT